MYLRKHLVSYIQYFIIADKLEQVFVGPHKGDDINTSVDAQANIASGVYGANPSSVSTATHHGSNIGGFFPKPLVSIT
ncbi:unnamed protein product [Rotaria sp. Silwood1]|nr:unnamed protein product [Rotaria sp. Silwood1]